MKFAGSAHAKWTGLATCGNSLSQPQDAHHGAQRIIFVGPRAQDILRRYLVRDAESFCFVPAEVVAEQRQRRHVARKTPMSCGNVPGSNRIRRKSKRKPRDRYSAAAYRRAIHRACDVADRFAHKENPDVPTEDRIVPRWSPNRLRHSAATEIRRRFGLEGAQVVLGHSGADTTLIYAERDLKKAAAIMAEVG